MIKMPNQSQEHLASSKAPNQDSEYMDVICTFKIKIYNQNLEHGVSKTSYLIQMKIKMPDPSNEPLASSKAPNQELMDTNALCILKIKIESQN